MVNLNRTATGLDFVFEKRILNLSSGWLVQLERLSDNATGGNMVESHRSLKRCLSSTPTAKCRIPWPSVPGSKIYEAHV